MLSAQNSTTNHACMYLFQGQERDTETFRGGSYNYTYRMHHPGLGRFFAVDPLFKSFPYWCPYSFSANQLINAIEFEGAESKIIFKYTDREGVVVREEFDYEEYTGGYVGILGQGTYIITMDTEGNFYESYEASDGDLVKSFSRNTSISFDRWLSSSEALKSRWTAVFIEKITEEALIELGFDEEQVRDDVIVLENDNELFKAKFAVLNNFDVYGETWEDAGVPSSAHESLSSKVSPEIAETDILLKWYSGDESLDDNVETHVGLVREGWFDHRKEGAMALFFDGVNIGRDNALTLGVALRNKAGDEE